MQQNNLLAYKMFLARFTGQGISILPDCTVNTDISIFPEKQNKCRDEFMG